MIRFQRNLFNYLAILVHLISLVIFTFHYLSCNERTLQQPDSVPPPLGQNVEQLVSGIQIKCGPTLVKPSVSKMVVIVIDALRSSFVPSIINRSLGQHEYKMPFVETLMSREKALGFVSIAETPTVTMPRIKAIVSGTHPSFMDLLYNLNAARFGEDNIIEKAVTSGKRILFFGDDTWLQMFPPSYFVRVNTTSSFFATDYTTVDTNVTSNMLPELSKLEEWDIMILHYLGVDHIGHSHGGAKSHLIPAKLREMDNVIKIIYNALVSLNEEAMIVVTGDHGMTEAGNHGGSTKEEVETALIAIPLGPTVTHKSGHEKFEKVMQIDLAVTLSALIGLDTPEKSKGKICLPIIKSLGMNHEAQMCHLFANALQMLRLIERKTLQPLLPLLQKALTMHSNLLTSKKAQENVKPSLVIEYYDQFISTAQSHILQQRVSHHSIFSFLTVAILIGISSLAVFIYSEQKRKIDPIVSKQALPSLLLYLAQFGTSFFTKDKRHVHDRISSRHSSLSKDSLTSSTLDMLFLLVHIFVHIFSLASTSFVEREQFYWFYIAPSYFVCKLILIARVYQSTSYSYYTRGSKTQVDEGGDLTVVCLQKQQPQQQRHSYDLRKRSSSKSNNHKADVKNSPNLAKTQAKVNGNLNYTPTFMSVLHVTKGSQVFNALVILVILRICASWSDVNQPNPCDIRTFLSSKDEKHFLSALVIGIFVLLTFITPSTRLGKQHCLLGSGLFWTYLYKSGFGHLASFDSRILTEVGIDFPIAAVTKAWFIYLHMVGIIVDGLLQRLKLDTNWLLVEDFIDRYTDPIGQEDRQGKRKSIRDEVAKLSSLRLVSTAWVLLSCLLSRCEVIPLIGLNVMLEKLVSRFLQTDKVGGNSPKVELKAIQVIVIYYMLAMNGFYAMGNSNSTSTIDVAAGFIGLQSYSLTLVSILVVSSTYNLYIYWILMLFVRLQESQILLSVRNKRQIQRQQQRQRLNGVQVNSPSMDLDAQILKMKLIDFASLSSCFNFILFIRFSCATYYSIVAFILQNHLFIWSVICPKLLYEAFHSLLLIILLLCVSLLQIIDN